LLFIVITTYSTLVSQVKDFPEEISTAVISESYSSLGTYRLQHYQEEYPILYIDNNRVYSGDGNLNWRLWMWQDQIEYMRESNLVLRGSGYADKLYVFETNNTGYGNDRTGLDDTNENLHNYFIQILSRGGIAHLILFIYFYLQIVKTYIVTNRKLDILFFLTPLLWISFFDSSMENAHFPLVFYYFLGNIYFKEN
jgi:O-antigen ligase